MKYIKPKMSAKTADKRWAQEGDGGIGGWEMRLQMEQMKSGEQRGYFGRWRQKCLKARDGEDKNTPISRYYKSGHNIFSQFNMLPRQRDWF